MWPQIIFAVVTMIVSVAVSLMMIKNQKTRTVAVRLKHPALNMGHRSRWCSVHGCRANLYLFWRSKGGGSEKMKIYIRHIRAAKYCRKEGVKPFLMPIIGTGQISWPMGLMPKS
jgi:hypothetical protein